MKRVTSIPFVVAVVASLIVSWAGPASATTFTPNNIMDDGVFDSVATMDAAHIDAFLNGFPNSCISSNNGFAAPDPTGYNPSQGYLYGGAVSAGQVIFDAAQAYGLNPQVILTTLQKEEGIVVGNGPYGCSALAISASAGYACTDSDTASHTYTYTNGTDPGTLSTPLFYSHGTPINSVTNTCVNSSLKAGFTEQVIRATWLLKFGEQRSEGNINWAVIKGNWDNSDDPQTCYGGPMTQGTFQRCPSGGSAYYDGYTTIDGTATHMDNGPTAALYWYTPHFSGNQSFVNIFTDWFGPTSNPNLYYALIQGPNSPAIYLQTGAGKYYIPSAAVEQDWGLTSLPIKQVSQGYIDNLPTHDWVSRLLSDQWGNLFMVDNGKLHYIRNDSYLPLWGFTRSQAVVSTGLAYSMPGSSWVGRFVQDEAQPSGSMWLMDNGQKRLVATSMLYQWRYTPDQLTTISANYLSSITTGTAVTAYASNGSTHYLIDSGQKLSFANSDIESAYYGTQTPESYSAATLAFLPAGNATQFVIDPNTKQWFMLENGTKHYISSGEIAQLWGKSASQPLTQLSAAFMASLPATGNLAYVVQSGSPASYWLIDGVKHLISTAVLPAWVPAGITPPTYSPQSLNALAQGTDATTTINAVGSPYTYTMDSGTKHYLMSASARSAWGGTVMSITPQLSSLVPEGAFVNYLVKNTAGQAYLLMNATLYPIDSNYYDAWNVTASTPTIADQTLARYTAVNTPLKGFITINGTGYAMAGTGYKTPIVQYADAYQVSTLGAIALPADYFNTTAQAAYIIRSSDNVNSQLWLVTGGKKISLGFEQAVSYGYLSRGVVPTPLAPAIVASIPTDTRQASLLIQKQGSGIKLLSFGSALGFPDGDTLVSYIGSSNPILQVAPSIFDGFTLRGSTSRLIKDDRGNLFWMDSGSKHYILNGTILSHYPPTPQTYLEGTTQYLIPSGSPAQ